MVTRPRVVLIGPPGSGKTTVGELVAHRLGVSFVDTDQLVERSSGREIAQIFVEDGEAHFRELEVQAVREALAAGTGVVALGGGAPMQEVVAQALAGHTVVFLDVTITDAAGRIGFDGTRPLLAVNPRATWTRLMQERRPTYERLATARVDTAGTAADVVAEAVVGAIGGAEPVGAAGAAPGGGAQRTTIGVGNDYNVVIGAGAWADLPGLIGQRAQRVLLVRAPTLQEPVDAVRRVLTDAGYTVIDAPVPDAEAAKTVGVAADLWQLLGEHGFTRTDAVVGLGGGATTDLAGFVAASWLRGVPVVQVPTTLLGMVDAAVGGKTGINTGEGKNLVGAFHPPAGVLADLTTLRTLPRADLAAGLAEVVKCGFIADPQILTLIESDPVAALDPSSPVLRELVERAIAVKTDVVAQDLRESSLREILNYGHTFGHAIEHVEGYSWRHGEAVAVGMIYAAELAARAALLDRQIVQRHRDILTALQLPVTYRAGQWEALLTAMRRDKKTRGSVLRFVALEGIAAPTRLEGPDEELLRASYDAVTVS